MTESERETPVAPEPDVPAKPAVKHVLTDPRPRFGSSLVSLVIWVGLSSSIVAIAYGLASGDQHGFVAGAISATVAGLLHRVAFSRGRGVVAVRRVAVKLPVLRDRDVQRIGALAGIAATTCSRCESFNLEVGQHALAQHGDFRMASAFLRPSQMQATKGGAWTPDRGFDDRGQPVDTGGPSWGEMGGCQKKGILVFGPHSCEEWS